MAWCKGNIARDRLPQPARDRGGHAEMAVYAGLDAADVMELAVAQCLGPCAVAVQIVGVHSLFPLVRRAAVFAVGELRDDWGVRCEGAWKCKGLSGRGSPLRRALGDLLRSRQNDDCRRERRDRGPTGKLTPGVPAYASLGVTG